ncbi:hypothetical protein HYDPIDRAFT_116366 [Hydnomerulius pinastri MD-312]|uniref:Uncharacterized protein n=1 Tax=Hydnomerulius pinastri MD-312 TaxID=994086 RepID=A0A0C9V673_9AGAM|nr:hypothetical protein HYDPIDRAFT_116366 [Hydnomerulius pinastri MD-312]
MLPFIVIFGLMLLVQRVSYSILPPGVYRRLGIAGAAPPLIGGVINGIFAAIYIEIPDEGPPKLDDVLFSHVVNDPVVVTSLALYSILHNSYYRPRPTKFPQIAGHSFDWAAEVKRNPHLYWDDIVPCALGTPEDVFCQRLQLDASGRWISHAPLLLPRAQSPFVPASAKKSKRATPMPAAKPAARKSKPVNRSKSTSSASDGGPRRSQAPPFSVRSSTKKSKPATPTPAAKSKPATRKSKPDNRSNSTSNGSDRKPRRSQAPPCPRARLFSTFALGLLLPLSFGFQYLHEWILHKLEEDQRIRIPTWASAVLSATITIAVLACAPRPLLPSIIDPLFPILVAYVCSILVFLYVSIGDTDDQE